MKQTAKNDNAANRSSFVGTIFKNGERSIKNGILQNLTPQQSTLHQEGYIHIHDLDAYEMTYNCLTFDFLKNFPYHKFVNQADSRKIISIFDHIKSLFTDMGNEQSGGMAFANFDNDIAEIFTNLNIEFNQQNKEIIASAIYNLVLWSNDTHTRMGQTSYYVTFNIGLAKTELARFIAYTLIDEFENAGDLVFKPNIVFKVKAGINRFEQDPNFYILNKALNCTAKKMIPTYVLCDSETNKEVDAEKISVMGCRTRVVDNLHGRDGAIGRGNIANISINLPRIALEVENEFSNSTQLEKFQEFKQKWLKIASITKDILLDRFEKLSKLDISDFPTNIKNNLWCVDFREKNLRDIFKHGTLSLGFIGLSEAMEVIFKNRYYLDDEIYSKALDFVDYMRDYCDKLKLEHNLNFSLLATSGELISGRFIEIDKQRFDPNLDIFEKGFYTNSFHINVDSNLSAFKKISYEGNFHKKCNGGCITYLELRGAPIGNSEGLREYIEHAVEAGTHYLGINFPKDVCAENDCFASGIFDECPECQSTKITRIRRVSGYLEILDGFTNGKKNEVDRRREN